MTQRAMRCPAARPEAPLASITRTLVYHELPLPGLDGVIAGRMDLSADGTRIAFVGGYDPNTIYFIEANGQNLRQVDSYTPSGNADSSVDPSGDGSKVLSWDGGAILRLANADRGGAHQVIAIEGGYKDFHLSADGSRITFVVDRDWTLQPGNQVKKAGVYLDWTGGYGYPKLATLTINPPSLGPAPQINDVLMTPVYLLTEGRSEAKVTARVAAASSPSRVGSVALLDDVQDRTVQEGVLVDGGSAGDAKPGEGIYTASPIRTTADTVTTGPRTMRVIADVVAADGTRHSTAVDVAAFDVRADHPSATIPPETGGALNYVDGRGNTMVITVPPWAFNAPTVLWLIPLPGVTPPNERATQRAFELLARQGSVVVSTPNKAVTVTIEYADEELLGLDEAKLRLKRFVEDGNQWVEAGCGPYTRLLGENTVKVSLCHLSRFGLFEDATQQLFLPVVQRP